MALPTFHAITAATGNDPNIALPNMAWPAGHAANDIGIFFITSDFSNLVNTTATPSGFTLITNSRNNSDPSDGIWGAAFWKRATSGAEANVTFSQIANTSGTGWRASIMTIRGCPTSGDPFDITAVSNQSGNATVTFPSITTTVSDCLIILFASNGRDVTSANYGTWTNANLASLTERIDSQGNHGNGQGIGVATGGKATAGAIGTSTVGVTADANQFAVTMAIKSADSIGGSIPTFAGLSGRMNGHLGGRF